MRVHIFGASGSGTTTLGRAIAGKTRATFLDTDDFYWRPTNPPFQEVCPHQDRLLQLEEAVSGSKSWILSGSLCGWGDPLISLFDLVVFLWVPAEVRVARLRMRERERFGAQALAPGGALHAQHEAFIAWAHTYDKRDLFVRSLTQHEAWLAQLPCPTLRFEGVSSVESQVARVLSALDSGFEGPPEEPRHGCRSPARRDD